MTHAICFVVGAAAGVLGTLFVALCSALLHEGDQ